MTNLRLLTWAEFQAEFESTWIERYLRPEVTKRLDGLMSLVEQILPRAFDKLDESAKVKYLELRDRYFDLGATAMLFTTYFKMIHPSLPDLPLRDRWEPSSDGTEMPSDLLDATAYGDFLNILIPFGERAAAELRAVLHPRSNLFCRFGIGTMVRLERVRQELVALVLRRSPCVAVMAALIDA